MSYFNHIHNYFSLQIKILVFKGEQSIHKQLDESLISPRQLKMMSPWKQIVLLSITGCLAGKILYHILYLSLGAFVVMVYVIRTSLRINLCSLMQMLLSLFLCYVVISHTKCMSVRL